MVLFGLHERTVNIGLPLGADLLLISFYYVSLFALPLSVIHFFYYILLAVYLIKKTKHKNNTRVVKNSFLWMLWLEGSKRAGEKELSEGGKMRKERWITS